MADKDNYETIDSVAKYIQRVEKETNNSNSCIFRGQENLEWPVDCSATRRLRVFLANDIPRFDFIKNYHLDMLQKLKSKYSTEYKNLSDLEIIADQQHRGAATMLIDFTRDSLIALYFACLSSEKAGAVIIVNCGDRGFVEMSPSDMREYSFEIIRKDDAHSGSSNNAQIYYWEPGHINKRIPAQHSIFLFGAPVLEKNNYTMIPIPKESKEELLNQLKNLFDIYDVTLFNDLSGFAMANNQKAPLPYPDKYSELESLLSFTDNSSDYKNVKKQIDSYFLKYPDDIGGLRISALLRNIYDDSEGAIGDYTNIINQDPHNSEAFGIRGIIFFDQRKYSDAIADFDKAISIESTNPRTFLFRGLVFNDVHYYRSAIKDFTEAIRLKSNYPEPYFNRGLSNYHLRDFEKAIFNFKYSIVLKSDYMHPHFHLAKIYSEQNNMAKALEFIEKASNLVADPKYNTEVKKKIASLKEEILEKLK